MKCVICKNGDTKKGKTTISMDKNGSVIVIKGVPADVCENCGEAYLDSKTNKEVLKMANESYKKGAEIEVITMKTSA